MLSEEMVFLIISLYYIEHYSTEQIYEHYNQQIPLQTIHQIMQNTDNETYIDNVISSFITA
jgi:hypothetical protein